MNKTLAAMIAAALLAGTALSGTAAARDRHDRESYNRDGRDVAMRWDRSSRHDRGDRDELTSNQIVDQFAARTARIKADLRLTPEQDKHWAGFATAMDDMAKKVAERRTARRDQLQQEREAARRDAEERREARRAEARQGDVRPGESRTSDGAAANAPATNMPTGESSTEAARTDDARTADGRTNKPRRSSDNFVDRMRQDANAMSEMAADRKTLADAAQPLYDSLDDRQRQRFAEAITNLNRRPGRD